jgi:spore coat polysaccharide biosynthesis protein SpsF (cytidylyltransferase family)
VSVFAPLAVIQARMGSSRLPGKVLEPLAGMTVLDLLLRRCAMSRKLGGIVVATSDAPDDVAIADLARRAGAEVFRGSEQDVLDRFVRAAHVSGAAVIVRLTADSPLTDPRNIDEVIAFYEQSPADYVYVEGYPLGLGVAELMTVEALGRARDETRPDETSYREHVMTYLTAHPERFALRIVPAQPHLARPDLRVTIDEPSDLELARRVCDHFAPRVDFSAEEIIALLDARSDLVAINAHVAQRSP